MDKFEFPKILDPRGNLTFVQAVDQIPFSIKRVYWVYDVPAGAQRNGHAFHKATECIIALSGSFDVVTRKNGIEQCHHLDRPFNGLIVKPGTWRVLTNFSTNSVALILSSTYYDPDDYIYEIDCLTTDTDAEVALQRDALSTMPAVDPHTISRVDDCRILTLPRHRHPEGSLSVVDNSDALFAVKRVFYLYDVPGDSERGGHSHYRAEELIIAVSGAFDVTVTDGHATRTYTLNRPYQALYIPTGIWRSLNNFSSGSVCLVLTSEPFAEEDYQRSFSTFKQLTALKAEISSNQP